ncbi:MAG: 4-(cytidine 5'-diphospho)-2-C-methyl-D-erythritol kinase [Sedimenticola sp.]|nr:4-(cytidine 5'-diphospho)-2-C-methyl-D-erythritol kinase [Sedimenticola sp.]
MRGVEDEWWPAPAKLNLMLRVVGRRADGYHLLQTVFRFIDFSDEIKFHLRSDGRVKRFGGSAGVSEPEDLAVRAARLLQQYSGTGLGVDITLKKRIPMGGGLGGGSSDAATVLTALNQLWNARLSRQELARLGLQLGADVPVFIEGLNAWAEGVGERLQPVSLPAAWYLVLSPPCHVSTADVFGDPELTRNASQTTIRDFLAGSRENDCLPVVSMRYPEVAEALTWLGGFAEARLTGTGGSVFAEFADPAEADRVCREAPPKFQAVVARGLDRSPLRDKTGDW